ncbi:MAG: hypothetical protein JSR98_09995 [Proteobacteria bacterium]|nr:hypothetical protein [Pseudomonadota bacterium]
MKSLPIFAVVALMALGAVPIAQAQPDPRSGSGFGAGLPSDPPNSADPLGSYGPYHRSSAPSRVAVVGAENEVGLYCATDKVSRCNSETTFQGAYSCLYHRRSKLQPDCRKAVNKLYNAVSGQS